MIERQWLSSGGGSWVCAKPRAHGGSQSPVFGPRNPKSERRSRAVCRIFPGLDGRLTTTAAPRFTTNRGFFIHYFHRNIERDQNLRANSSLQDDQISNPQDMYKVRSPQFIVLPQASRSLPPKFPWIEFRTPLPTKPHPASRASTVQLAFPVSPPHLDFDEFLGGYLLATVNTWH